MCDRSEILLLESSSKDQRAPIQRAPSIGSLMVARRSRAGAWPLLPRLLPALLLLSLLGHAEGRRASKKGRSATRQASDRDLQDPGALFQAGCDAAETNPANPDHALGVKRLGEAFQAVVGKKGGSTWLKSLDKAASAASSAELSWMTKAWHKAGWADNHGVMVDLFRRLAFHYGHGGLSDELAGKAYRVFFMVAKQDDARLRHEYSKLMFKIGNFVEGQKAETRSSMIKVRNTARGPEDVTKESLTTLMAELNTISRDMGSELLKQEQYTKLRAQLEGQCGGAPDGSGAAAQDESGMLDSRSMAWCRSMVARCIISQNLINITVADGADPNVRKLRALSTPHLRRCDAGRVRPNAAESNGLNSLHYAAAFGELAIVEELLRHPVDVTQLTPFGQTALHLAVLVGAHHTLPVLLAAGVPAETRDRSGRTAVDVACYHPWAAQVAAVFETSLEAMCKKQQKYKEQMIKRNASKFSKVNQIKSVTAQLERAELSKTGDVGGLWLSPPTDVSPGAIAGSRQRSSECDVEIRVGLTPAEFANDYVLLNRPVLIRGALVGSEWETVRRRWKRNLFEKEFGSGDFDQESIPYSSEYTRTFDTPMQC